MILASILLILFFMFFIIPMLTAKKTVEVPSCKNLTVSKCEKKLQKLGFDVNPKIKSVYNSKIKKGKVIRTNPGVGRSVKHGTTITIYKSKGEETFKLGNYVGKNYNDVKSELQLKYGLVVNIEKKEVEEAAEDTNLIIEQSLPAGTKVKKGDTITLFIPNLIEQFPDMVASGWTKDDAEAFAKKYGLNLKVQTQATTLYNEGKIIDQSRAPGTSIVKGSNLTITVATKPKETPKPSPKPTPSSDEQTEEDDNS